MSRSIDELVGGTEPLAGAEQRMLREWVSMWTFDIDEFSTMAQPLIRGDLASLQRDFSTRVTRLQHEHSHNSNVDFEQLACEQYASMRETRLRMPAMEVVIAGAQYSRDTRHRRADHAGCLRFLHSIGCSVDASDVAGFTAFMRASQTAHSRLDLAHVLLDLGACVNHRSRFGGVALHEAIMAQDRTAVAFLSRNGANMDIKDNDGVSPRDIVSLIL
ncbi:hypothetical protein IWW56_001783 [Coemansia sp. RSA 2131]|nr:hypothetical protein IWW56_001783 [Coemansia sp. RSA 2131]